MALDKLKELLGEDLYNQVSTKLGDKEYFFAEGKDFIPVSKFNETNEAKKQAEATIKECGKQLADLQKAVEEGKDLKATISALQEKNTKDQAEYEAKIVNIQKNYELDRVLTTAKAKNVKALKGMLDMEKVTFADGKYTGLDEQIEEIRKNNEWLFEQTIPTSVGKDHKQDPNQRTAEDAKLRKAFGLK